MAEETGTVEAIAATRPLVLMTVHETADLLCVSSRHVWSLDAQGLMPSPIRLGKCCRWRRDEIETWLHADAPPRDTWDKIKTG